MAALCSVALFRSVDAACLVSPATDSRAAPLTCARVCVASSLRGLIEKPPVVGKELQPLTNLQLTGFRLHAGPVRRPAHSPARGTGERGSGWARTLGRGWGEGRSARREEHLVGVRWYVSQCETVHQ